MRPSVVDVMAGLNTARLFRHWTEENRKQQRWSLHFIHCIVSILVPAGAASGRVVDLCAATAKSHRRRTLSMVYHVVFAFFQELPLGSKSYLLIFWGTRLGCGIALKYLYCQKQKKLSAMCVYEGREGLICRHVFNGTLGVELSPSSVLESKYTMPLALVVLLFPVINLKSPSFFYKFNALGTVSVFYLLIYILINAFTWGINVDFVDETSTSYVPLFRTTFPALTGVLCLSFFIHNCVISMMRNQKNPEHNARDLSVAFGLVITTYLLIAVPFYISFPLAKHCIEDNLLNNFSNHNVMAFVTRIFLLVQYTTLFPMITYLLRVQFMHWVYRLVYPGGAIWHLGRHRVQHCLLLSTPRCRLKQVMALNAVVVVMCVLFAIFLPQIGTILRFCGALSGLVYIFTLPCIIYMVAMRGKLTACSMVFHSFIILLGLANFASQFLLQYLESLA
ncbi:hypothetical protein HPB47_017963 [Ixodes persulcatus]|uniref:Uncharacterized protein n=1 Tax=Ixodes persulcatus TaxID=34615 RepID=A0AC60QLX2_IXOPE|nr:hypothetical protein HPB47_017963 [Ixodes persulcatus]